MNIFRIRKGFLTTVLLCFTTIVVFYSGQQSSNSLVDFVTNALRPLDGIFSPQPDDDPWFQKCFIRSIKPFLTRENKKLSNDTRTWWRKMQNDRSTANFSEVVEKLFQVIPDADLYPERHGTCAVVGNSGNLKRSHYGAVIDSSDEDVGNRTTYHVMYPESAIDLENATRFLLIPFKTLDLQWLPGAVLVLNPVFMKYVHESWLDNQGKYPSTGFMALILALHICDEVNVYGFGEDRDGNWHHYWETLTNRKLRTGLHNGSYEYNVTVKLSEIHKLQIHKGFH
ncbi:unnamed protein product [Coregonus sp. 'balchen']|nr:unnamed protein product [Coregonus sp. 'balchen']